MGCFVRKLNRIIRRILLIIFFMLFTTFFGCDRKVGNVHIENRCIPTSQIFTEEEIEEAMDAVVQEFELSFANCTLTDIWYVGDESNAVLLQEKDGRASETRKIFIYTNFNINSSTGIYATCNKWQWIVYYGRVWRIPGDWHVLKNGYGSEWLTYDEIGKILYDAYHGIVNYDIIFYSE